MDKIKLTNHIKDIDLKNKMFKVIDKANSCLKHYDVKCTDFLNPYEIKNAIAILNSFNDIKYSVDGGYDNAERKVIFIYPYYMEYDDIECPLEIVQVEGNFKFKEISHKDYLGAILNLGIVREKIGDIINTGTSIDGAISRQLLINIFIPNTPLHDGAVVIRDAQIKAAACFLPLTQSKDLSKDLGTRHRAAVGVSEVSDCISLIVSEETGDVSIAKAGKLYRNISKERMINILRSNLKVTTQEKGFFKGGIFK